MFDNYLTHELETGHILRNRWLGIHSGLDVFQIPTDLQGLAPQDLNIRINRLISHRPEPRGQDQWHPPQTTWHFKQGDCEDISILKIAVLRRLGVPATMVLGRIANLGDHAFVLLQNGGHVLDNLFDRVLPFVDYLNFTPLYAFSGVHAYRVVPKPTMTLAEQLARGETKGI